MKKTTLSLLFLFFAAVSAKAQLESGTFFAGGTLAFASSKQSMQTGSTTRDLSKSTTFIFSPDAGVFIFNRTAVGIFANIGRTQNITYASNGDKTTITNSPVNIGLFGRHYFMVTEPFGFTGTLAIQGMGGGSKTENFDQSTNTTTVTETSISGIGAGLLGGVVWFATPHIGIEANIGLLGFQSVKTTTKNSNPEVSNKQSNFLFGVSSFNLNFGFNYYF